MAKFRKRPVVIEAVQFDPEKPWPPGVEPQVVTAASEAHRRFGAPIGTRYPVIVTKEGTMIVQPGDWVIRGVQGEYYPCKPDIFKATYSPEPEVGRTGSCP